MELLKQKKLIIYGIDEIERKILESNFKELTKEDFIIITANMGQWTLSGMLSNLKNEEKEELLPDEKIIIFNGYEGIELQNAVFKVRKILNSRPILASTTPVSIEMKLNELVKHLIEERDFQKNNLKKKSSR